MESVMRRIKKNNRLNNTKLFLAIIAKGFYDNPDSTKGMNVNLEHMTITV